MQKIFCALFGFICLFNNANAGSDEILINQLVKEKNEKLAMLEQCTKKVTGFKTAGISTLGLTAVGVVGNIALKNKNNEMDNQIAFAKNELQRQQEKMNKAQTENAELQKTIEERKAECETHSDIAKWDGKNCVCKDEKKFYDEGVCYTYGEILAYLDNICEQQYIPSIKSKMNQIINETYTNLRQTPKNWCNIKEIFVPQELSSFNDSFRSLCLQAPGEFSTYPNQKRTIKISNEEISEYIKLLDDTPLSYAQKQQVIQRLEQCIVNGITGWKISCKCY